MRALVLALVVAIAGCPSPIPPPDAPAAPDAPLGLDTAGPIDAPAAPDSPSPVDAPIACVVAGGTDADHDGHCTPDDCDDDDAAIHPGATEVCTVSVAGGSVPVDESCDGRIDEECTFDFGERHGVTDVGLDALWQYDPQLSTDGLRLYYTRYTSTSATGGIAMATRASLSARFDDAVMVPIASGLPAGDPNGCGLSSDERQVVCSAGTHLYVASRADRTAPSFGAATRITAITATADEPHITPDGTELFYVSEGGLWVAPAAPPTFGAGVAVTVEGLPAGASIHGPTILPDGRTMLVVANFRIWRAYRDGPGDTSFVGAAEIGAGALMAWYHPPTRELFVSAGGPWGLPPMWRLFRQQICADGACPPEPEPANCPSGASYSPNRFHCFYRTAGPVVQSAAAGACNGMGGTLATIHSSEENALVAGVAAGAVARIGLRDATAGTFTWPTGEPDFYQGWAPSNPNIAAPASAAILVASPNQWDDIDDTTTAYGVCENWVWPTW